MHFCWLSILLYKNNKTLEKLISSSFKRDDNVLVQLPKSIENNIDNFISRYQNFENKIQEYLQKNVSFNSCKFERNKRFIISI